MCRTKTRSVLQKSAVLKNLAKSGNQRGCAAAKENVALEGGTLGGICQSEALPTDMPLSEAKSRGDKFRSQLNQARRALHRSQQKCNEFQAAAAQLQESGAILDEEHETLLEQFGGLFHAKERLRAQALRGGEIQKRAIETAVRDVEQDVKTYKLKDSQGTVSHGARRFAQDLVQYNIPVEHISTVITSAGQHLGVEIEGSISTRTVSRLVTEAGIKAKIKTAKELELVDGFTVSGDGTGHHNVQYESRHVTYILPGQSKPVSRLLGIDSAPNHTSQEQITGWKHHFEELCELLNGLPSRTRTSTAALTVSAVMAKAVGINSDHAADMKKTAHLFHKWKIDSDREVRGLALLACLDVSEFLTMLLDQDNRLMVEAGGPQNWNATAQDVVDAQRANAFRTQCVRLGEEAYAKLSPKEQHNADRFIWGGCCMHKESNTVKWGNKTMQAWWKTADIPGPLLLPNKAGFGPADCGAIKATSLAGAIFKNKDNKKGQQDAYRFFFQRHLGYATRFPDTSNTRFQSHCLAAEELLLYLELYRAFLEQARDNKESPAFTNIEHNVYSMLSDQPTQTEMAALALYAQSITHPYMRAVRGQAIATSVNLLDLGPLHKRVVTHCQDIIARPELLLSPDASYQTGSLDGLQWERPEVFYKIHHLMPTLPHLRSVLVAFLTGALAGWVKFSEEFADNGEIASLTAEERARIFLPATNDVNEGGLGTFRLGARLKPSITLDHYNSRALVKMNSAGDHLKPEEDLEDEGYVRGLARKLDGGEKERKRRDGLACAHEQSADEKRGKVKVRDEKKEIARTKFDTLVVWLDTATVADRTVKDIVQQINWHRQHEVECSSDHTTTIEPKTKLAKLAKPLKVALLIEAITRYTTHITSNSCSRSRAVPFNANEDLHDGSQHIQDPSDDAVTSSYRAHFDQYGEDSDNEI